MNQSPTNIPAGNRIAFIRACWHADIVDEGFRAFGPELERQTGGGATVESFQVPGAFEIPLLARRLAQTQRFAAVVGCAFVVDGGIYRHDFVAATVVDGLMRAQMDTDTPVLSVVLTPHHFQETEDHRRFFLEHFRVKGREAAAACATILTVHEQVGRAA